MTSLYKATFVCTALLCTGTAYAANEVNVYSYRQPYLIEPMFDAFTQASGVKVNVIYAEKGLVERLKQEGELSPADVILTVDIKRLTEISDADLAQPLKNSEIEKNIPAQFRDSRGEWFGLTLRARAVYSSKDRVGKLPAEFDYLTLTDAKYKGKICTRSFKHPYNLSLVSAMVAHYGKAETQRWLEGVKANLARKPQGNDRDQIKAIKEGVCDLSLGNSYYLGKMLADSKQRPWADAVEINFPGQKANGVHVNISGVALAKHAPNKENAVKLIAFLSGDRAQEMYAEVNAEYPVKPGVKWSQQLTEWGTFTPDALPVEKIAEHYSTAVKLVDDTGFDL